MICKHCNAEIEEGVNFCPACGAAQTENGAAPAAEAVPAKAGLSAGKIALLVVLAVAAIAVIIALVLGGSAGADVPETTAPAATGDTAETVAATIPADGNPDDVTCKGSYTVAADAELNTDAVVATMGEVTLTNAELQVYYWMQVYDFLNSYGSYASMFGLDYTQSMDTQLSIDGSLTWQQYFLDCALDTWVNYQAMCLEANAAGYTLDETYAEYLASLPEDLEESAVFMGYESAEAMVQADMGPGATVDGYLEYLNTYYLGYMYYGSVLEAMEVTDAQIEAYFDAHAEEYLENGLEKSDECYVDVRHILIAPEGGTTDDEGNTTYSDEEWAAAEAQANEVLNEWLSGEKTEDTFATLAGTYSVDTGSSSNGGLYEDVYVGQMVEPFENWCFDASRQQGDYGIVQTTYGYHIMYFVGSDLVWYLTAQEDMMAEQGNAFLASVLDSHPAQIDYTAIELGNVELAAAE